MIQRLGTNHSIRRRTDVESVRERGFRTSIRPPIHSSAANDPTFDAAAARAILEAARDGDTGAAEEATGYYWGEPRLRPHVERILAAARAEQDDRLEQLAERWLR